MLSKLPNVRHRHRSLRASWPLVLSAAWLSCARPGPLLTPTVAPVPESAPASAIIAPTWQLDRSTFDASADPCGDFYQHVCGGFEKSAQLPPDRAEVTWARDQANAANDRAMQQLLSGTDNDVSERVRSAGARLGERTEDNDDPEVGRLRTFFASCMASGEAADKAGDATLTTWLGRIDGIKKPTDVMAVVRELHAHGVDAWFRYSGEPDRTDRTRFRGEIAQGTVGSWRIHAEEGPDAAAHREAYRAHIQRMFELSGVAAAQARSDARAVVELEGKLAAVALSFGDQFDPDVAEHAMTPSVLAALAAHIDWTAYLKMVGHPPDRPLNVTSPTYLKAVDAMIAKRPIGELRASLRWVLLYSLAPALPARLADERYRFTASAGVQRGARADECQLATLKALGVELSRQFSQRFIGATARARAQAVAERVQGEMARAADTTGWLSPAARAASAQRLTMLALKVGFPTSWPATGAFPLRAGGFLDNVLAAQEFEQQRAWSRARTERRRDSWEMTVYPNAASGMAAARLTIPNGFPDAFSNSIVLTAAALRPPLFDAETPPEVRYGGFGFTVAHELVHVLENHMFDEQGGLHDAWSAADVQAGQARRACEIDQANQFVAFDTVHLDGKKTISENLADLSGIVHAYAAMAQELGGRVSERGADGLTPAQRFFFSYAQHWCAAERPEHARENLGNDSHAPPRYRVNGPLSNLPAFAEAFACPKDAAMVRPAASRCVVW